MSIVNFMMGLVSPIRNKFNRKDDKGASLVEYALLLALVAVVAIVALQFLGHSVTNTLNSVGSSLNNP